MIINIYTDGGSRGNPGPASIGVSILNEKKEVILEESMRIGIATNNEAEYKALIRGLTIVKEKLNNVLEDISEIHCFLDSTLVVRQITGFFKVKDSKFKRYIFDIRVLEQELGVPVYYHVIAREENKRADMLVNKALQN